MMPTPPENWNNSAAWDKYWSEVINKGEPYIGKFLWSDTFYLMFENALKERGVKRVLFVGNGLSQAPKFFAFRGFEAVALDLSNIATEHARNFEFAYEEFYRQVNNRYFPVNKKVWLSYCEAAQGVTFISGSLFDADVAPGPFELIISSKAVQGFARDESLLKSATRLIDRRLSANGCFFNVTHNFRLARDLIERELEKLGYLINKGDPRDSLRDFSGKFGWNIFGSG